MINLENTRHCGGLRLTGDVYDFQGLIKEIDDLTKSVENEITISGVLYYLRRFSLDLLETLEGHGEILMVWNGVEAMTKTSQDKLYPKRNVYFQTLISWPKALFLIMMVEESMVFRRKGKLGASLYTLERLVEKRAGEFLSPQKQGRLFREIYQETVYFEAFAIQYLDYLEWEYLKMPLEKRKENLTKFIYRVIRPKKDYLEFWQEVLTQAENLGVLMEEVKMTFPKGDEEAW